MPLREGARRASGRNGISARRDEPDSPSPKMSMSSMKKYSAELKSSIVARMLPPNSVPIPDLVRETGIPKDTLYTWRTIHGRSQGQSTAGRAPAEQLSSAERFAVVLETASLNELELSEYCRRKGLYPDQISAWRETCQQANAGVSTKVDRARLTAHTKKIKKLEIELRRKDKALAEAAALLILQKKVYAIWAEDEDEKLTFGSGYK